MVSVGAFGAIAWIRRPEPAVVSAGAAKCLLQRRRICDPQSFLDTRRRDIADRGATWTNGLGEIKRFAFKVDRVWFFRARCSIDIDRLADDRSGVGIARTRTCTVIGAQNDIDGVKTVLESRLTWN